MKNKTTHIIYPKVSIITCVYNGEKYISKLLDSVLNMGYPNIEHIIVNDGSTDSTEDIVMKYVELYKNKENSNLYIKYIKQENMGLGGATNTGLKQITGEYWTWINCDDWYEPGAFFVPVIFLAKQSNLDYVLMNGYKVFENKKKLIYESSRKIRVRNKYKFYIDFCNRENFDWTLWVCKTSSFKSINSKMIIYPSKYTQDEQFGYQMFGLLAGDIIHKPLWNFLRRNDSFFEVEKVNLNNEGRNLYVDSIGYLDVEETIKSTLIKIMEEESLLIKYKSFCRNHNRKEAIRFMLLLIKIRAHISFAYRRFLDKKLLLYLFYSLI